MPTPWLVVTPSESLNTDRETGQSAPPDPSSLRRSISKSREVLSVKVSRSHLKKNISKSRERLCDMKFSEMPMRPDQFPSCLRSSVSEVPDNRPPWKGAGVQKTSPGAAKAERVNTFKLRDEYQSQVAAGLAASSQPHEGGPTAAPSPFVRHGSLRGRRKTSTPEGSTTDLRSSLRRGRNADCSINRRNSCQEESKTLPETGRKKEGPRRTQSVSDAIMHARRNRNSRKDLLLPVEENRSGSESVDVLADGQEMVRIRPGTFVIDMGEQAKSRKKSIVNEEDKKLLSGKEVCRKNASVDPPEKGLRNSFRASPSVEIEEAADKVNVTQPNQRQPSPDTRKLSVRRPGSLPASPRLTPRSTLNRKTSPLRQGSPRRQRDSAEPAFERSTLQRSSLRSSLRQTRTPSRPASGEESRRQPSSGTEEPGRGLRKSSTDEDMRRLSSLPESDGLHDDERRLQKSSTVEDVHQLTGSPRVRRSSRRSPMVSRNVSSPLLLSRSPTSDLGSSELSGDDWEQGSPAAAPRDRPGRTETSSVARAISRFQALEQEGRQGTVSPTAGRSPAASRKFSSPALRSPDPSRKASLPALRSPCVTRKASSPALRSPCITRKASSPALGAASQRERGFPSRAPGLRAA